LGYAAGAVGEIATLRNLRQAIFNAASACIDGAQMDDADLAVINAAASVGAPRPVLTRDGVVMRADDPFAAMMAEIAGDAIALLGGERRARLRRCGGCNMLFFDASPPGRRKWCSSAAGCGNQAKTRNRRARIAAQKQGKVPK
jgi:predicted RNA-binding Zn ribbon-like protein